jgi:hypothetical protein
LLIARSLGGVRFSSGSRRRWVLGWPWPGGAGPFRFDGRSFLVPQSLDDFLDVLSDRIASAWIK